MTTQQMTSGQAPDVTWAGRHWRALEFPLPDGGIWRLAEPSAQMTVVASVFELRVERFERQHHTVQIFDNPKHLVVATEQSSIPRRGESVFSVQMAAESIACDPADYRNGFAAFNVFDLGTASIFDHIATSSRALAVHEHLLVPGVTDPGGAHSWFVEAPLSLGEFDPSAFHEYAIAFDPAARRVRWLVDDQLTFEARDVHVPDALAVGLGLFTLRPIVGGRSVSVRGQGAAARWRELRTPR